MKVKVKAIINFNDVEEKVLREKEKSVWTCDEERAKFLLEHNAIEIIEKEEPVEEPKIEYHEEKKEPQVKFSKKKKSKK